MSDEQRELVLHMLGVGDWSSAIATYQEDTGADLESATTAVRQLARRNGIRRPIFFLAWLAFGILVLAFAAFLIF